MVLHCILLYDGQLHMRASGIPAENTVLQTCSWDFILLVGLYICTVQRYLVVFFRVNPIVESYARHWIKNCFQICQVFTTLKHFHVKVTL